MSRRPVLTSVLCGPWLNDWDTITTKKKKKKKRKKKKKKKPRARVSSLSRLHSDTHSDNHHTRYDLSGWVIARRRELYLTKHNYHNRHTTIPQPAFEPAIPTSEHLQTHAFDRTATGIGNYLHKTENGIQSGCLNNKTGLSETVSCKVEKWGWERRSDIIKNLKSLTM